MHTALSGSASSPISGDQTSPPAAVPTNPPDSDRSSVKKMDESNDTTDEALLQRWAKGDVSAGELLWERHNATVKRTVSRFIRNQAHRDDYEQEAWLNVLRYWGKAKFDDAGSFSAWLYVVTCNVCHTYFRRKYRLAKREVLDSDAALYNARQTVIEAAPDLRPFPADIDLASVLNSSDAVECLRLLPPQLREAVIQHLVDGLGFDDLADLLGCAPATAWKTYHRGLRSIQWCMKQKGHPLGRVPVRMAPGNQRFDADVIDIHSERHSYDLVVWGLDDALQGETVKVTLVSAPGSPTFTLTIESRTAGRTLYGDKRITGQVYLANFKDTLIVSIQVNQRTGHA